MRKFKINPILRKEAKVRMRNWKAPFMIGIYVGILTFIGAFMLYDTVFNPQQYILNMNDIINVYIVLAGIQFLLICFIVPALTASSISNERERQTLDLLLSTRLEPRSIILGKLEVSISQILLLIVAGLPLFSVIFVFGGISFKEMCQLVFYYIVVAITFGSIGIFFSTYFKKTTTATVLTYGAILFLMLGTLIISIFYISIEQRYNANAINEKVALMYFNPGAGFISMMVDQFGISEGLRMPNIISNANGNGAIPFWGINMIIDIIISLFMLTLSSYKLNPMRKKK